MAETRFTPGPWFYGIAYEPHRGPVPLDYRSGGHSFNAGIIGADGATVAGCDEYHIFGPSDPDVRKANISLIAAAPDLYEVLESAEKKLKDVVEFLISNPLTYELTAVWDGSECDGACLHDECRGMAEDIAHLRAKARGEGR